jgi:hypothetical protein
MRTDTIRLLRLRALALLTVAGTAWISFSSSQDLAVRAGFGLRSWAFPICLDAVAAFAVDVWMRRSPAQRPAATLALTAIGLSLASNVADHYITAGTVLAALLGGIPPAMLAWLLLVLHKHGQPDKSGPVVTEPLPDTRDPAPVSRPTTVPIELSTGPSVAEQAMPTGRFLHVEGDEVPEEVQAAFRSRFPRWEGGAWVEEKAPAMQPEPPGIDLVKPLPVNVPDNDPERTQIMPRITDEAPGKFDPTATEPAPSKVQPARRSAPEVSAEVASASNKSNDELIMIGVERHLTSRRAVMSAFGVGTKRATDIARAIKEKLA